MKVIRSEIAVFLERQESIVPWKKKGRSPSPVEEKSEHSSDEED